MPQFKVLIIAARHEHASHWAKLNGITAEQFHHNCQYVHNESNLVGYRGPLVAVVQLNDGAHLKHSAAFWYRVAILKHDDVKVFHVDAEAPDKEFMSWMTKTTETMST